MVLKLVLSNKRKQTIIKGFKKTLVILNYKKGLSYRNIFELIIVLLQIPYDITYMWNLKYDTSEPIYETETESWT